MKRSFDGIHVGSLVPIKNAAEHMTSPAVAWGRRRPRDIRNQADAL